jgi:hypothetical protein
MSAHTPGPWTTVGPAVIAPALEGGLQQIAECWRHPQGGFLCPDITEAAANAQLIAAAPDLLALMRDLTTVWDAYDADGPVPLDQIISRARAIVARVEGGAA